MAALMSSDAPKPENNTVTTDARHFKAPTIEVDDLDWSEVRKIMREFWTPFEQASADDVVGFQVLINSDKHGVQQKTIDTLLRVQGGGGCAYVDFPYLSTPSQDRFGAPMMRLQFVDFCFHGIQKHIRNISSDANLTQASLIVTPHFAILADCEFLYELNHIVHIADSTPRHAQEKFSRCILLLIPPTETSHEKIQQVEHLRSASPLIRALRDNTLEMEDHIEFEIDADLSAIAT